MKKEVEGERVGGNRKMKTWENARGGREGKEKRMALTGWFMSFWKIIK